MKLIGPHYDELRASGLTDETIERAGIHTETRQSTQAVLLGWTNVPAKMGPAIVFPFHRADGTNGYSRLKFDHPREQTKNGKKSRIKYESPRGVPNEIYIPPGTFEALDNPQVDLLLTEGEKKALCADQHGFKCIGLIGVYGWKQGKHERLILPLQRIAWKGRKVFIAFDSDMSEKPEVEEAANRLAYHLRQLGAVVLIVHLPHGAAGEDGKTKKNGLDDFIVANGIGAFFPLLKEATEPGEVSSVEMKLPAADLDPASEIKAYLKTGEVDGISCVRFWRGSFWKHRRGQYCELPTGDVRSHVVNHLNQHYSKLTTGIVANCMQQMQAQTLLGSHVEAPSWLADREPPFSAAETLACRNGLLHLPSYLDGKDGHFLPLTPRFFSTCSLDFDFNPDALAPLEWLAFLASIWGDDQDSIETLREIFGYLLLPDTSQHKIFLLCGPPRSGKGVIAKTARRLVGERNVAAPTLASLGTNFGVSPLVGKSLAIIGDARLGGRADIAATTERLLSISGEDVQTIDRKNQEPITCRLPTRFLILTNELPRLSDTSGALANRMIILRTSKSFLGSEDRGLFSRIEGELSSLLLWSIVGWDRLRRRGRFEEPATAAEMRAEFNDLTSPIGAFVRECCLVGPEFEAPKADTYQQFKTWCESVGRQYVEDQAGFGKGLRAVLPQLKSVQHQREWWYRGLGLRAGTG